MRIFLDANILFSAARADGAMRRFLADLRQRSHRLVASSTVIHEAQRNLSGKATLAAVEALSFICADVEISPSTPRIDHTLHELINWLPDKDQHVLAASIALRCDVLITGDRTHFGAGYGKKYAGVLILSPRDAAERLLAE